jgi:putative heme-binding domain-containing protein
MRPAPLRALVPVALTLLVSGASSALGFQGAPPKLVAESGPRTPEEEKAGFHLPEGFAIELVAAEPEINKPMNLAFDDQGRLWVTSTVEYPYPVAEGKPARDRVVILSDFAPDGRARSAKTFAEGLNIPIGLMPLGQGDSALVHSIPSIRRHDDTNGDGKADRSTVLYEKYGFRDTHGMTNAFSWGFDGWIYACHGFSNESKVEGADKAAIVMQSGNVYRMRPDGSHLEYVTHGQVNPFGLAFDPMGNLYSADCHSRPIYQLLRGAYYPSFGKPDDGLGFGPEMIGHDHGSTGIGGIAYYAADQFPPAYRDTIFIGNVVTSRVNHDHLVHKGSSPRAIAEPDFVVSDDPWFRPVDLELGPDGALYIADFYNRIIGHYEVPLDHPGRDRERGRIWRVVYKGKDAKPPTVPDHNATTASVAQLISDLGYPNLPIRTRATNQLVARGVVAVPALVEAVRGSEGFKKVHALWALERLGALEKQDLHAAIASEDEAVRVHAARILAERPQLNEANRGLLLTAIAQDTPSVRRAAAEALGRHPAPELVKPLLALVRTTDPADDHLRHVARIALRDQLQTPDPWDKVTSAQWDPLDEAVLADVALGVPSAGSARFLLAHLSRGREDLATKARFARHVARHGGAESEAGLVAFAKGYSSAGERVVLLKAIQQGTQERGAALGPDGRDLAAAVATALIASANPGEVQNGIELAGSLKLEPARGALAAVATSARAALPQRSAALTSWTAIDPSGARESLGRILRDAGEPVELRETAANLLVGLGQPETRATLVEALATAPARLQTSIASGLALSRPGAEALLNAVAAGKASARPLQERGVVTRLQNSGIPDLSARLDTLLKDLPPADKRVQDLIEKRKASYLAAGGDISRGVTIFEKTCASCHQLEGRGAKVGPQLDGVGVRGLDRLLEDTLDPNRNVDQAFRSTTLALSDGRIATGLVLRQDGAVLVVADAQGKEVRIPLDSVEDRKVSQLSPMPANLADQVEEADFRHLLAYLLSQKPVDRGAAKP